jgi:uncharacterized RDD family membrane protein YckC
MNTAEKKYPEIVERIKAMFIDTFVMVIFIYLFTFIFGQFDQVNTSIKIITFIFIYILIDPIFTSLFGGTIGHFIVGIRVKNVSDENKNIKFHIAIIRFLAKVFLGAISFIVVSQNEKRRAIHDFISGSIVLYKK